MEGQQSSATTIHFAPTQSLQPLGSRILTTNEEVGNWPLTLPDSDRSRNVGRSIGPNTPNPATEDVAIDHHLASIVGMIGNGIGAGVLFSAPNVWNAMAKAMFGFGRDEIAFDQRPERIDLKERIRKLLRTAGLDNWDGEGALAVSEAAVNVALVLADKLPDDIDDPDVSATPHGEVDFDWMEGRCAMLTISIDSDGTLAWAALFDEYRSRGTARWTGELACPVECCLRHLASL